MPLHTLLDDEQKAFEKEKEYLGGKIHRLLNKTLERKLTHKEYTQLVLYIAGAFDLTALHDQKIITAVIGMCEKLKGEHLSHDLKMSLNPCTFFADHEPVWDGNYYTCAKCGQEFVKAKEINKTLSDLQQALKKEMV